jgi:hypothetical protein
MKLIIMKNIVGLSMYSFLFLFSGISTKCWHRYLFQTIQRESHTFKRSCCYEAKSAIDKIAKDLSYQNVIFITENKEHNAAARKLGMMTIRLKQAWETDGEVNSLFEMIPLIHLFVLTLST